MPRCSKRSWYAHCPLVLELRGVGRLVVGGVEVVHAGLEAGVHERQVLIGQRHVQHEVRLDPFDQRYRLADVIRVHLRGLDGSRELCSDGLALLLVATRQHDALEHLGQLRALVGDDLANPACADDQDRGHVGDSSAADSFSK